MSRPLMLMLICFVLVPSTGRADEEPAKKSEPERLKLWNGNAALGDGKFENAEAWVTVHRPEKPNGAVVVICPGGGYGGLVTGTEDHGIATWPNRHGVTGVVLEYRLPKGRSFHPLRYVEHTRFTRSRPCKPSIRSGAVCRRPRSTDGSKTWGKPEVLLDPKKYTAWPRRIRVLRDGRIIVLMGVAPLAAGSHTREALGQKLQPILVVFSDQGKTWQGPIPAVPNEKSEGWTEEFDVAELEIRGRRGGPISAVPKEKQDGWTEEFDVAELENGDLLAVYRRGNDTKR